MDSSQVCKQEEIIAIGYSEEGEEEEEGRPPEGVSYRRTVVIDDRAKQWRYIGGRA